MLEYLRTVIILNVLPGEAHLLTYLSLHVVRLNLSLITLTHSLLLHLDPI